LQAKVEIKLSRLKSIALRPRKALRSFALPAICLVALLLTCISEQAVAQMSSNLDSNSYGAYIFLGVDGFLPFKESYRINYATKTIGLPIELYGGLSFVINQNLQAPLGVRFIRRAANFITGMDLQLIQIEPGLRLYIEKYREKELRLFLGTSLLLSRATITGPIDLSTSGDVTGQQTFSKDYYNIGLGIDLGLTYPLTERTGIDAFAHIGLPLGNPISHGGLGNLGGVSVGAVYKFGL
jgi:hypothetical protein